MGWSPDFSMGYVSYSGTNTNCTGYANWAYVDGNGTVHSFPTDLVITSCIAGINQSGSAFATDQSGYFITVSVPPRGRRQRSNDFSSRCLWKYPGGSHVKHLDTAILRHARGRGGEHY